MLAFKLLCLQFVGLTICLANADRNISVLIKCPATTTGPPTPKYPPGYVYYPNVKTAYKVSSDKLDWANARHACIAEGGSLAVIDTREKVGYVTDKKKWLEFAWTGIYEHVWGWESVHGGSLPSRLPWSENLPGRAGNRIAVSGVYDGLIALWSWDVYPYVCEIPDNLSETGHTKWHYDDSESWEDF